MNGIFTEVGTVFVDSDLDRLIDADESSAVVNEDCTWTIPLTATESAQVVDKDNYVDLTTTPLVGDPLDEYLPLGFIDKAGNGLPQPAEFYYFNIDDGGPVSVSHLTPADRPETAVQPDGTTQYTTTPTESGYTMTFTDASQII